MISVEGPQKVFTRSIECGGGGGDQSVNDCREWIGIYHSRLPFYKYI